MSTTILQEIEIFSKTIAILESAAKSDESSELKRKQAVTRLRSRVTMQDATRALEDATLRGHDDDRKDAERAVSALMESLPDHAALEMIKKGLSSPDGKLRASSLNKLVDYMAIRASDNGLIRLALTRLMDVDSQVAKTASDFAKKLLLSAGQRENVISMLHEIESGEFPKDSFCGGKDLYLLRLWELAAKLSNETEDAWLKAEASRLLDTMFTNLETWNDDVLFVLNQLEIAASLPRSAFHNRAGNLINILLRYANEQKLVADDALRVLAALHFENNQASRPEFFAAVERRMSQEFFSLASLEVLGLFMGANSDCLKYATEKHPVVVSNWLQLVAKFAHDGNDVPRNVALDAVCKLLRGGSLLREPNVSLSTIFKQEGTPEFADAQVSSGIAFNMLKDQLTGILRSVNAAIRSLHPNIQIAGYLLIRMMVSQNAKWGIVKVFEHIPKDVLLNIDMPSPNTNMQCVEARYAAISSCALKFLTDDEDASLLRAIKQFVLASKDATGSLRFKTPTVDVATMRA